MEKFLYFASVIAFFSISEAIINCNKNACSVASDHTMCKYPDPNPSKVCGTVISAGLTNDEKEQIVRRHNELRQYVAAGIEQQGNPGPQPPAENMKIMEWDDAIADVAQRWANQCNMTYDQCRDDDRFYVGQSITAVSETGGQPNVDVLRLVQIWYNQVKQFDRNQVSKFTNDISAVGYTQLVWATSYKLGCGKIIYQKPGDESTNYYLVCNYAVAGNWVGYPVYDIKD